MTRPKRRCIPLRIPAEMREWLEQMAAGNYRSMNAELTAILASTMTKAQSESAAERKPD